MRAEELDVRLTTTVHFSLVCPVCKKHRISVPISLKEWQWDGDTLTPSIQFEGGFRDLTVPEAHQTIMCKGHFTITKGEIAVL